MTPLNKRYYDDIFSDQRRHEYLTRFSSRITAGEAEYQYQGYRAKRLILHSDDKGNSRSKPFRSGRCLDEKLESPPPWDRLGFGFRDKPNRLKRAIVLENDG